MNPQVDMLINNAKAWKKELQYLRTLVLKSGLEEEVKWGGPCYTHNGKNICMIAGYKAHCVLSFFNGYALSDPHDILDKPGENSKQFRLFKFTSIEDIASLEPYINEYILEAINLVADNKPLPKKESTALEEPDELLAMFKKNAALKKAFHALTPGRQRGYIMYFSAAKQSTTRSSRIESYKQRIMDGKGMQDCICGLSKKMPSCDGSHKQLQ